MPGATSTVPVHEPVVTHCPARSLGGLCAGQWVTTGSCTGTVLVAPGTVVVADFPCLGRAELQLG